MSRWLDIAARAELNPIYAPANRREPAISPKSQPEEEFLPVSAGLPVRDLKTDQARRNLTNPDIADTPNPKIDPMKSGGFPHGKSPGGRPLTYIGRVVSLDAWRRLSEWEKHGPAGKQWNGTTQKWETPT